MLQKQSEENNRIIEFSVGQLNNQEQIVQISPEILDVKNDINYFRIFFNHFELWCLKRIVAQLSPFTTRDIYLFALEQILYNELLPKNMPSYTEINGQVAEVRDRYYSTLHSAYQNFLNISEEQKDKIGEKYYEEIKDLPSDLNNTKRVNATINLLKEKKLVFPSQQTIKKVLIRFKILGILITENKGYLNSKKKEFYWRVNPYFYANFKDKIPDILNL